MAVLELTDADVQQPAVAPVVVEGMQFDLTMIDTAEVAVGLEHHQNKHQTRLIPQLDVYTGGAGGRGVAAKYPSGSDAEWHRVTTAPIVSAWVSALDDAGRLDPPGRRVISTTGERLDRHAGHLFVASALKDSAGKLYASYHCYPG